MDNDLFKSEQPNTDETRQNSQSADPFATKLQEIRNESGEQKYRDVATALDALKSSQSFIEQLKQEKRQLEEQFTQTKAELDKMGTIDDYVARLSRQDAKTDQPKETPSGVGGLSEERVAQILQQQLEQHETQSRTAANLAAVNEALTKAHGDAAGAFVQQKARELNTTPEALKKLASENPTMALTLLGGTSQKAPNPSSSSVNPPRSAPDDNPMPKWDRGVSKGGLTRAEVADRWAQAKAYTYKRIKVEE